MTTRRENISTRRRIGVSIRRLAERNELARRASFRFGRFIDSNPGNSHFKRRLQALRVPFQPAMSFRDVQEVAVALQEADLKFWFAGGWGIDVLVGLQSRDHLDLDIVIEDYRRDEPRVCRALSGLGYVRPEPKVGGIWMPSVIALSDWSGRRIELMEIDWERFAVNSGLVASDETGVAVSALRERAFAEGVIFAQKLPCLSRRAQLLFHSNFTLSEKQRQDLDVLNESRG